MPWLPFVNRVAGDVSAEQMRKISRLARLDYPQACLVSDLPDKVLGLAYTHDRTGITRHDPVHTIVEVAYELDAVWQNEGVLRAGSTPKQMLLWSRLASFDFVPLPQVYANWHARGLVDSLDVDTWTALDLTNVDIWPRVEAESQQTDTSLLLGQLLSLFELTTLPGSLEIDPCRYLSPVELFLVSNALLVYNTMLVRPVTLLSECLIKEIGRRVLQYLMMASSRRLVEFDYSWSIRLVAILALYLPVTVDFMEDEAPYVAYPRTEFANAVDFLLPSPDKTLNQTLSHDDVDYIIQTLLYFWRTYV